MGLKSLAVRGRWPLRQNQITYSKRRAWLPWENQSWQRVPRQLILRPYVVTPAACVSRSYNLAEYHSSESAGFRYRRWHCNGDMKWPRASVAVFQSISTVEMELGWRDSRTTAAVFDLPGRLVLRCGPPAVSAWLAWQRAAGSRGTAKQSAAVPRAPSERNWRRPPAPLFTTASFFDDSRWDEGAPVREFMSRHPQQQPIPLPFPTHFPSHHFRPTTGWNSHLGDRESRQNLPLQQTASAAAGRHPNRCTSQSRCIQAHPGAVLRF